MDFGFQPLTNVTKNSILDVKRLTIFAESSILDVPQDFEHRF